MQQAPFTLHSAIVFTLFCILPVGNGRSKKLKGVSTKSTTVKWAEALNHLINFIISPLTKSLQKISADLTFFDMRTYSIYIPPFSPHLCEVASVVRINPSLKNGTTVTFPTPRLSNGFRGSSSTPTQGPAANFVTLRNVARVTVRVTKPRDFMGGNSLPPRPQQKKQKRGRKRPWNSNIKSDPQREICCDFFSLVALNEFRCDLWGEMNMEIILPKGSHYSKKILKRAPQLKQRLLKACVYFIEVSFAFANPRCERTFPNPHLCRMAQQTSRCPWIYQVPRQ